MEFWSERECFTVYVIKIIFFALLVNISCHSEFSLYTNIVKCCGIIIVRWGSMFVDFVDVL